MLADFIIINVLRLNLYCQTIFDNILNKLYQYIYPNYQASLHPFKPRIRSRAFHHAFIDKSLWLDVLKKNISNTG